MLSRIVSLFRKPPLALPALVRVLDGAGRPVPKVRVRGEFSPSGRAIDEHRITAQGLCLFPWPAGESSLRLLVQSDEGSGSLVIESATSSGNVAEVRLGALAS